MSSVRTSLSNVSGFINAVSELHNSVSDSLRATLDYVSTAEHKAIKEITKVDGFIKDMNRDLSLLQEVFNHNQALLCDMEDKRKILEKRLAQAQANLESAQEAQTAAKNSSSGSTEAEKKAHDSAVASAGKAVSSASSEVSSIKRELNAVKNTIGRLNSAISRLINISYEIKRERSIANDFIKVYKMKDKASSLKSVAQRAISECDELRSNAERAKNCLVGALDSFADASDSNSCEDEVNISSVQSVLDAANILESMKSETEAFAERQKDRTLEFEEVMGDGISASMANAGTEIAEIMKQATSSFNEKADFLRNAYSKLMAYLSCG